MINSYGLFFCVGHIRNEPRRDPDFPDLYQELSHPFKALFKSLFLYPLKRTKTHLYTKTRFFHTEVTQNPCEIRMFFFPCLCGPAASPFPPRQGGGGGADAHTLYLIRPLRYRRTLCQKENKLIKMISI